MFICEKDAIASLVSTETRRYDVPLAIIKDMSSKTFLWDTALAIDAADKETHLYFLGDHDDARDDIVKSSVERIRRSAQTEKAIHWRKLAIDPEQIEQFNLPLRPPKPTRKGPAISLARAVLKSTPYRPEELRRIVRETIEQHVDLQALEVLEIAEENEVVRAERAANLPMIQEMLA
jgi:hypothetical protein